MISAFRIAKTTAITSRAKRGLVGREDEESVTRNIINLIEFAQPRARFYLRKMERGDCSKELGAESVEQGVEMTNDEWRRND